MAVRMARLGDPLAPEAPFSFQKGERVESQTTRRHFLRGAGASLATAGAFSGVGMPTVLSIGTIGCATIENTPITHSDFSGDGKVGVLYDYSHHSYDKYTNPKGIDFTAGLGALLAAPTIGDVWDADTIPAGTLVKIETPFGHVIELSCESAVYVKINDKVTPFTLIGREGKDCGKGGIGIGRADHPHVHVHLLDPPFATKYKTGHLPFVRQNGISHPLIDPSSYRAYGSHLKDSIFTGDVSHIERLIVDAQRRLYSIADRHPDSFFASFIRESNTDPNIRFAPKVMETAKMLENGFLVKLLKEEVEDYLRWYSNLTGFLFAPYTNPQLIAQYRHHQPRVFEGKPSVDYKGEKEQVEKAWGDFRRNHLAKFVNWRNYNRKDWFKVAEDLEEFRKLFPVYAEITFYINAGLAYARLGNFQKAASHLLIAEGLFSYKFEPIDAKVLSRELYWTYRNLDWVLQNNLEWSKADTYRRKWSDPSLSGNSGA